MSRRSFLMAIGIFLFLVIGGGSVLVVLLRYEPPSYQEATLPPGKTRKVKSDEFNREFWSLVSAINNEQEWVAQFSDKQINSYFDENFVQSGLDSQLLPDHINKPRVVFKPGRICLAFRYGKGIWSTIVSIDLRVWLVKNELNVVALELERFRAGALPIAAQSLLERISEVGIKNDIGVTWYRHSNGHPVALLRFQHNKQRPTLKLLAVQLEEGKIKIKLRGRGSDVTAFLQQ